MLPSSYAPSSISSASVSGSSYSTSSLSTSNTIPLSTLVSSSQTIKNVNVNSNCISNNNNNNNAIPQQIIMSNIFQSGGDAVSTSTGAITLTSPSTGAGISTIVNIQPRLHPKKRKFDLAELEAEIESSSIGTGNVQHQLQQVQQHNCIRNGGTNNINNIINNSANNHHNVIADETNNRTALNKFKLVGDTNNVNINSNNYTGTNVPEMVVTAATANGSQNNIQEHIRLQSSDNALISKKLYTTTSW